MIVVYMYPKLGHDDTATVKQQANLHCCSEVVDVILSNMFNIGVDYIKIRHQTDMVKQINAVLNKKSDNETVKLYVCYDPFFEEAILTNSLIIVEDFLEALSQTYKDYCREI